MGSSWLGCCPRILARVTAGTITGWSSTVLFRTRTGCPWRDLPEGYGNWKTVYDRHRRWSLDGTLERVLDSLRASCDEAGGADWTVSADLTVVRGHQHAAGARRSVPAGLVTGGTAE
jgi:transposase